MTVGTTATNTVSEALRLVQCAEKDFTLFIEVIEEAAEWMASKGIDQWKPGWHRDNQQYLLPFLNNENIYLAHSGDELAGAFILSYDGGKLWKGRPGNANYLSKLVIRRKFSGHGASLLKQAEDKARDDGALMLRLDCLASNERLCRYYMEKSYEPVATFAHKQLRLLMKEKHL